LGGFQIIEKNISFMKIFSDSTIKKINLYIRNGYNMRIDVGLSYNGPYLIKWVKTNKKNIVIGFEPHPQSFENLKIKISEFPKKTRDRIFIFNYAISNVSVPTSKKFFSTGVPNTALDPGASSLLKPIKLLKNSVVEAFRVRVIPLDYFLNRIDYKIIEFIKIDTQGSDLAVLKSLNSHIRKVHMIQAERDCTDYYDKAASGNELDEFMIRNNFTQVGHTKNKLDSLFINTLIPVLDFVPPRFIIVIRKFPKTLGKFVIKSPIVFTRTILVSIFYDLNVNLHIYFLRLKHLTKILLK
jgi:FkbM family methyltransferase